jgi:hypothetical protein
MGRQPGAIVIAIGLLGAAGWSIAIGLGAPLARLNRMWSVIVAIVGLGMLIQYLFARRKSGGLLFAGVVALVMGAFLSLFTLRVGGILWADMARYWPVIPFTIGAALLLVYIAEGMQQASLIVPAFVIGGLGLFALPITLGIVRGQSFAEVLQLWPLLIIFGLLVLLFRPPPAQADNSDDER